MLRKKIVEWIVFGSAFGGEKSSGPIGYPALSRRKTHAFHSCLVYESTGSTASGDGQIWRRPDLRSLPTGYDGRILNDEDEEVAADGLFRIFHYLVPMTELFAS